MTAIYFYVSLLHFDYLSVCICTCKCSYIDSILRWDLSYCAKWENFFLQAMIWCQMGMWMKHTFRMRVECKHVGKGRFSSCGVCRHDVYTGRAIVSKIPGETCLPPITYISSTGSLWLVHHSSRTKRLHQGQRWWLYSSSWGDSFPCHVQVRCCYSLRAVT